MKGKNKKFCTNKSFAVEEFRDIKFSSFKIRGNVENKVLNKMLERYLHECIVKNSTLRKNPSTIKVKKKKKWTF